MSWKGVKKSISRLPHQFKTRNGGDDVTQDLDYSVLEKRYKEYVQSVDELRIEVMTYRDNLSNMLNYQLQSANHIAELCGLQMEHDSVDYDVPYSESYYYDIPPKTKQALEDYATAMAYCKQENMSMLDDIDAYVLRPIDQYQMISKTIDKTITKRQHKLIDFDRHRISYMKFSSISEPTPSEEKHIIKLQAQFDNAAREYEYFNTMLKEELAYFLDMTLDFIEPVFQVFYDVQCRITGGIYSRLDEVIQHNSANFPTLDLSVGEGYTKRLEERNAGEELDNTDLFKKGLKSWERRDSFSAGSNYRQPSYQREGSLYSNTDDDYLSVKDYPPPINRRLSNASALGAIDRRPSYSSPMTTVRRDRSFSSPERKQPPPLSPRPSILNQRSTNYASFSGMNNAQPPLRPFEQETNANARAYSAATNQQSLRKTGFGYELKKTVSSGSISTSSTPSSTYSTPATPPIASSEDISQAYHRLRRSTISSISKPSSPFSDNQQDEEKNISPAVVKKKRTPPPPPPSKRTPAGNINKDEKKEYAEALYNLDAPQDGDLSFRVGDRIEIVEKTEKSHDWWKGRIGDRVGMFPANYVRQL